MSPSLSEIADGTVQDAVVPNRPGRQRVQLASGLLAEGRRFGAPGPDAEGLGAEHFDGVLASAVVSDGGEHLPRGKTLQQQLHAGSCCQCSGCPLCMTARLAVAGWSVHHVTGACLFDHRPSPQGCALRGGTWDDSR